MKQRTDIEHDRAWIQCYTGRPFWPLDPDPNDVDIIDIAWSLSMQCRYAGHTNRFYSVAEHCVHISNAVPQEHALWGLLHDSAEAYLTDLPRPLKRNLPDYLVFEAELERCIAVTFNLSLPIPAIVKEFDTRLLGNERQALMKTPPRPWYWIGEPVPDIVISCWSPEEANQRFLDRYYQLVNT